MCSIFGVGLFKDHSLGDSDTLIGTMSRLLKEAEVGGHSASGISIMREKTVHVLRRPMASSALIETEEYADFMTDNVDVEAEKNPLMSIIGHCRMPTKGSVANNLNNHPVVIDNIIGVHNGHIGNDDELFESFRKVITRKAQVDTEIIFQLISHFTQSPKSRTVDAIQTAAPYLLGSYACGMQNTRHPFNLYLFRHSNPIKILFYPKMGLVFFATREHFITRAWEDFADVDGDDAEVIDLIDDQGIVFNLWNHTSCKFIFRNSRKARELGKHAG